jgi:hypothetical protein
MHYVDNVAKLVHTRGRLAVQKLLQTKTIHVCFSYHICILINAMHEPLQHCIRTKFSLIAVHHNTARQAGELQKTRRCVMG